MRFKIRGEKIRGERGKLIVLIREFIRDAEREYEEQSKKFRMFNMPVIAFAYFEEDDGIVLANSIRTPTFMKLFPKPIKTMENNLKGFFKGKGLDVDVEYIGD